MSQEKKAKAQRVFWWLVLIIMFLLMLWDRLKDENGIWESAFEEAQETKIETDTQEDRNAEKVLEAENTVETDLEADVKENTKKPLDKTQKMFGENCISDQTYEVELSQYSKKVYFVPFAPSTDNPDFHMQIIQNGEVLDDFTAYIPEELANEKFTSLDAVSFWDVNYDDYTDIVLIQTYGDTTFATIYEGFVVEERNYRHFAVNYDLSENITKEVAELTIPNIRHCLATYKKNGEFASYQEAYEAMSRLNTLENNVEREGEFKYDLIYVDEDEIPELVVANNGYWVSLYTYKNGRIYTLMDREAYGTHGNDGYQYSPKKNNIKFCQTAYAGAIFCDTYMAISKQYSLDVVAETEYYNFDDANGNGEPDEDEKDSDGGASYGYINAVEVSVEECERFDVGGYEYIEGRIDLDTLLGMLK